MAAFLCRFCGAGLELSGSRVCECGSCGRIQSVPLLDSAEKAELIRRAEQLRSQYRYDKAIQLFEKMIQLSPADADLYWGLALCRFGVEFFRDGGIALNRTQAHSFLTDSDYRQALRFADEKQRGFMEQTAGRIDEKRREIAEIASAERYDVFLCCCETDKNGLPSEEAGRASELYRRLSAEELRVFYPHITLEDKSGSEWEPYIFGALNSAKVMLVVGMNGGSFEDIWVRNAWSRFISGGMDGRAVIPVVYDLSANTVPPELSRYQAIDMSRLGYEHDLILSVKALLSGRTSDDTQPEKSPLVRRAYLFLEDGDFSAAEGLCERIDQTSPAEASLIRLLVEYRLKSEEELDTLSADIIQSENYRRAMQAGGEAFCARLKRHGVSARYNYWSDMLEAAADEQTCLIAANGFEQLGGFRDSAEKAALARKKSEDLRGQISIDPSDSVYSVNVKPVSERIFTPLRIGLLAGGLCAAAVFIAVLANNSAGIPAEGATLQSDYSDEHLQKFEHGMALYSEESYAEAELVFTALGDYDNSGYWADQCRYMQAEQLLEAGDAEKAMSIFERLGAHEDSRQRAKECGYALADALEKQGRLEEAENAFKALGSYLDSVERGKGCRYQTAVSLYDSGDKEAAAEIFSGLGDFSDSRDYISRISYSNAEEYLSDGNYSAAYELFSSLGSYSDSAGRAAESRYLYAKALLESGNDTEARSILTELGDYKDSAELLNRSWLSYACERIDAGYKRDAYEILMRVEDYAPAREYIASLRNEILSGADWSNLFYFGRYYYFDSTDVNKVVWRVLKTDGDMALVVSENALDYLPFDENGGSEWAESSLRSWLNGEFYESAFSDDEKALIMSAGNGVVTDKVFLLNLDEALRLYNKAVSAGKYCASFYAQKKIPKDVSEVHSWGIDGLLAQTPTETGYERKTASPAGSQLIFPAMWVRIG